MIFMPLRWLYSVIASFFKMLSNGGGKVNSFLSLLHSCINISGRWYLCRQGFLSFFSSIGTVDLGNAWTVTFKYMVYFGPPTLVLQTFLYGRADRVTLRCISLTFLYDRYLVTSHIAPQAKRLQLNG